MIVSGAHGITFASRHSIMTIVISIMPIATLRIGSVWTCIPSIKVSLISVRMMPIRGHVIMSIIPGIHWNVGVISWTSYDVFLILCIIRNEWGPGDAEIVYMCSKKLSSFSAFQYESMFADALLNYVRTCPARSELITMMNRFHSLQIYYVSRIYITSCRISMLSIQHTIFGFLQISLCEISYSYCVHISVFSVFSKVFYIYLLTFFHIWRRIML